MRRLSPSVVRSLHKAELLRDTGVCCFVVVQSYQLIYHTYSDSVWVWQYPCAHSKYNCMAHIARIGSASFWLSQPISTNSNEFKQTSTNFDQFKQILTVSTNLNQILTGLYKFKPVSTSFNKFRSTSTNFYKFGLIYVISVKFN